MKFLHLKTRGFIAPLLSILIFAAALAACNKPQPLPDEDAATFKKRLTGIYTAQVATGLDGTSDAMEVLAGAKVFGAARAVALFQIDQKAAIAWETVADRLQKGFTDGETTTKIQDIIADVEKLERDGAIEIKDEKAKSQFYIITGGLKTTLTAWQNLLLARTGKEIETAINAASGEANRTARAAGDIAWVFNLSNVVLNSVGRAARQTAHPTAAAAYADGANIIGALKSKNASRIAFYSGQ